MKINLISKLEGGQRGVVIDSHGEDRLPLDSIPLPNQAEWQARQEETRAFLRKMRANEVETIPVPEGRTPESIQQQLTWMSGNGLWITSRVSTCGKFVMAGTREALELWEAA